MSILPPRFTTIILLLSLRPFIYTLPLLPFPPPNPTDVLNYETTSKIADRFVRWDAVHYLRKAQGLRAPSKCSSSSQVKPPAQPPSAGGEGPPQGTYEANDIQGAKRDEGGTLTETKLQETFQSEAHPSCPEIEYNEVRGEGWR